MSIARATSGWPPPVQATRSQVSSPVSAHAGQNLYRLRSGAFTCTRAQASGSNEQIATGRLVYRGRPVVGARIRVDRFRLPAATNKQGRFSYRAPRYHVPGYWLFRKGVWYVQAVQVDGNGAGTVHRSPVEKITIT